MLAGTTGCVIPSDAQPEAETETLLDPGYRFWEKPWDQRPSRCGQGEKAAGEGFVAVTPPALSPVAVRAKQLLTRGDRADSSHFYFRPPPPPTGPTTARYRRGRRWMLDNHQRGRMPAQPRQPGLDLLLFLTGEGLSCRAPAQRKGPAATWRGSRRALSTGAAARHIEIGIPSRDGTDGEWKTPDATRSDPDGRDDSTRDRAGRREAPVS